MLEAGFRSCLRPIPPALRSSATGSTTGATATGAATAGAATGAAKASLVGLVAAAPQALQRVLLLLATPDAIAVSKTCTTLATAASVSVAVASSATTVGRRGWHAGGDADKSKAKGAYLHTLANFTTVQVLLHCMHFTTSKYIYYIAQL